MSDSFFAILVIAGVLIWLVLIMALAWLLMRSARKELTTLIRDYSNDPRPVMCPDCHQVISSGIGPIKYELCRRCKERVEVERLYPELNAHPHDIINHNRKGENHA